MTVLYFIIALGLLVFIHEFGHFIVAKKMGIGVEKFSLGFGPKLLSFTRGETTYMVSALPLGGYVKLVGEDPGEGPKESPPDKKSYAGRPIYQRAAVVFAGPFMNLVLAAVLMPIVFMIGRMEPVYLDQKPVVIGVRHDSAAEIAGLQKGDEILDLNGQAVGNWKDLLDFVLLHADEEIQVQVRRGRQLLAKKIRIAKSPETHAGWIGIEPGFFIGSEAVIDEVTPGSPAEAGGMKAGDEVIRVNGAPVENWIEMSEKVGESGGKRLEVTVRRDEKNLNLSIQPLFDDGIGKWLMGVRKDTEKIRSGFVLKKYSAGGAIVRGMEENVKLSELTLTVLGRLVTFQLSYKTLGGPIRIAQASAAAAKSGAADFVYFLCFLSLQLGLLNLLPLPVLDGGHLLFFGIEAVRRRPLSARIRGAIEQAGFFLLLFLMFLVTLNDVQSVWGLGWLLEKIKNIF